MKTIKLIALNVAIGLFLMACNQQQPQQVAQTDPYGNNTNIPLAEASPLEDDGEYWAKDNFDLKRVGNVLERSRSPQEFETYINEPGGINNLDLNGDGYVDYISVDEYPYADDYSRGLSLYTGYGPNERQELGTVVFYRDEPNYPGARILVTGNEQIYGDNYYYEANWVDRAIAIASALFSPRPNYYRSPYYYDNYPPGYTAYQVVDRPVYYSRIEQLYPQPLFAYTSAAPAYIQRIKIKSPNNGLHLGWTKARFAKPTKEQAAFYKNNRGNPHGPKVEKGNQGGKFENDAAKPENKGPKKDNASRAEDHPNQGPKMHQVNNKQGNPGNEKQGGGNKGGNNDGGKGQGKGKGKGKP